MSRTTHKEFMRRLQQAVENPTLRQALERSRTQYAQLRANVMADLDLEGWKTRLREVKDRCLPRIPELLERFRGEAEKLGAVVHVARDADELNAIVLELMQARNARLAVKSKSMVTEETGLNHALEAAGIRVVETDLGEWILQLAGEKPSHFVTPAIHKTREEVAALFSQATGRELPADIPTLVQVAREELRRLFFEADVGITGANLAIAESGSLLLVTNEGNGRLVSSLPPVHIAVLGIEKLVETLDDSVPVLKLLGSNATGQKLTAYTTFITGPSRTADIEKQVTLGVHGPKELHIVFIDNGRSDLLADPEFVEALYCIKCSACLNVCPVFMEVGGHAYGTTYTGGIGTILTAFLDGPEAAREPQTLCAGCRSCMEVCPAGVPVADLLLALRRRQVEREGLSPLKSLVVRGLLGKPGRFNLATRAAACFQAPFVKDGMVKDVPFFPGITEWRALPALASKPLRKRMPASPGEGRPRAALFAGCVIDLVYPEVGEAVAAALEARGYDVFLPEGQACCGIPALYVGDRETAITLARQNVEALAAAPADLIVTACPTCHVALTRHFAELLDGPDAERAAELAAKTRDFSQLAGEHPLPGDQATRVTYHDPCHLRRGVGIWREPRAALQSSGYELVEMAHPDECCGFAGSFSLSCPAVSRRILERKLDQIAATGAEIVATDCPGCLLQLRGGLAKTGSPITVCHTAELLARALTKVPADTEKKPVP